MGEISARKDLAGRSCHCRRVGEIKTQTWPADRATGCTGGGRKFESKREREREKEREREDGRSTQGAFARGKRMRNREGQTVGPGRENRGERAGKRRDRDSETGGVQGGREKAKGSYLVVSQLANFQ